MSRFSFAHAACTACRAWSHGSAAPALFPFVVEGELVFDFFVRLAGIFMKAFVTGALRRRVMFVGITGFHERLLPVMFAPIFFFGRWIDSFCHSMCTISRGDATDNTAGRRAYRPADRGPNGCASNTAAGRSQSRPNRMRSRRSR
jgi:hypothetical protein